jgi:hypothetical protein
LKTETVKAERRVRLLDSNSGLKTAWMTVRHSGSNLEWTKAPRTELSWVLMMAVMMVRGWGSMMEQRKAVN